MTPSTRASNSQYPGNQPYNGQPRDTRDFNPSYPQQPDAYRANSAGLNSAGLSHVPPFDAAAYDFVRQQTADHQMYQRLMMAGAYGMAPAGNIVPGMESALPHGFAGQRGPTYQTSANQSLPSEYYGRGRGGKDLM